MEGDDGGAFVALWIAEQFSTLWVGGGEESSGEQLKMEKDPREIARKVSDRSMQESFGGEHYCVSGNRMRKDSHCCASYVRDASLDKETPEEHLCVSCSYSGSGSTAITGKDCGLSVYGNVVENICNVLGSFQQHRVSHVRRDGNSVARCLAKLASQHSGLQGWITTAYGFCGKRRLYKTPLVLKLGCIVEVLTI